jgi:hypothetical protein
MLRRIFGPKRDEMTGGWRKLYKYKLHEVYSSSNIIRIIKEEMGRLYSIHGNKEECIESAGRKT